MHQKRPAGLISEQQWPLGRREGPKVGPAEHRDLSKGSHIALLSSLYFPLPSFLPSVFLLKKYSHTFLPQLKIAFKGLGIILSREV